MKNDDTKKLSSASQISGVNRNIESLHITPPDYVDIHIEEISTAIEILGDKPVMLQVGFTQKKRLVAALDAWLTSRGTIRKCIAARIVAPEHLRFLVAHFWLVQDIVPFFIPAETQGKKASGQENVINLRKKFDKDNIIRTRLSPTNEVSVSELVTLDDYKKFAHADDFSNLFSLSKNMRDKRIVYINASPRGGGVALMRHSLIQIFRMFNVDAHWHVLTPSKEAFDITKWKFHNVLQGVADASVILTEQDKKLYKSWIGNNAVQIRPSYDDASIVVIDDPQPSGLIPHIKKTNPETKIIYRSHIQIDSPHADIPGTQQHTTWKYLSGFIRLADAYVSHPVNEFVPHDIQKDRIVFMPATTDPMDGLNKRLTDSQRSYYIGQINRVLLESGQEPLNTSRPYIIQVARFDPSKGIPDVLEAYKHLCERMQKSARPQLVICGHGSIDDPDGIAVHALTLKSIRDNYSSLSEDIKVALLPPSDQMLNALMSGATVSLQLSHKEGFEVKVTEALMKKVPVIGYDTGGIPLQIRNGVNGYIVRVGDTKAVADLLYNLLTNDSLRNRLRQGASQVYPGTSTLDNAIGWLSLFDRLIHDSV